MKKSSNKYIQLAKRCKAKNNIVFDIQFSHIKALAKARQNELKNSETFNGVLHSSETSIPSNTNILVQASSNAIKPFATQANSRLSSTKNVEYNNKHDISEVKDEERHKRKKRRKQNSLWRFLMNTECSNIQINPSNQQMPECKHVRCFSDIRQDCSILNSQRLKRVVSSQIHIKKTNKEEDNNSKINAELEKDNSKVNETFKIKNLKQGLSSFKNHKIKLISNKLSQKNAIL